MSERRLFGLIADHLRAAGWREYEPGRWLAPGQRKPHPKRPKTVPLHSLLAAAQSQITMEYYADLRAERARSGHPDVPEPLEAV